MKKNLLKRNLREPQQQSSRTSKEIFTNLERNLFEQWKKSSQTSKEYLLEPWKKSSQTSKKIFSNIERNLLERSLGEQKMKWKLYWIEFGSPAWQARALYLVSLQLERLTLQTYNIKYWIQMGWNIPTVWSCKPASPLKVPFPSSVTVFRSLFINFSMEKASIKKERNSRTICFHT